MELLSRIRAFFRSPRLDADLDDELQSHLALLEADNIRKGMTRNRHAAQLWSRWETRSRSARHTAKRAASRASNPYCRT